MIQAQIEQCLQAAVQAVLPDADVTRVLVRPCADPAHGDYQTNALMGLAKQRQMNPRELATQVVEALDVAEWCGSGNCRAGFPEFSPECHHD